MPENLEPEASDYGISVLLEIRVPSVDDAISTAIERQSLFTASPR